MVLEAIAFFLAAGSPVITQKDPPRREDEVVCKQRAATGTRFAKKTCKTRAEWEAASEAARRDAADTINRPAINQGRD